MYGNVSGARVLEHPAALLLPFLRPASPSFSDAWPRAPGSALVSPADAPWYHCVAHCSRRAYLCGADAASRKSFEHHRGRVVSRIKELATPFVTDVAAYVVVSNYHHLVLRMDASRRARQGVSEMAAICREWRGRPILIHAQADRESVARMADAEDDRWNRFWEGRFKSQALLNYQLSDTHFLNRPKPCADLPPSAQA